MQIDCAQSGCARPRDVAGCLQHIKLCSQSGSKIPSGHVEGFIRRLHVFCFALEYAVSLLEIEKCAADLRGYAASRCCQGLYRRLTPGARRLHTSFSRVPIEDVPRCVYSHHAAVVKFRTDVRISLAINFVPRKGADLWTRCAPIQNVLAIFNLNVLLPRFNDSTVCISPRETIVKVRMIRSILQLSRNFERRRLCAWRNIRAEKLRQSQIRVFQVRLRVKKFRPLVSECYLGSLHI